MRLLSVMLFTAGMAFFVMFSPWTKSVIPFWLTMPVTTGLLAFVSVFLDRNNFGPVFRFKYTHIPIGLMAAGGLYLVFWVGYWISTQILPFAVSQMDSIYAFRDGRNPVWIALLLLLVIGPAEEIFWRGFIQQRLSKKYGVLVGFILATVVYTLVHIWSFNFMLITAAAVCGGFWGLLFILTKNLWPCILSHAIWDVIVFIVFPIK